MAGLTADLQKRAAAEAAMELVKPNMLLGLGTGSTAAHFIDALAKSKIPVKCFPTSKQTHDHAKQVGLVIGDFHENPVIDLTVDGADEFDPELRLIKGGGGALLIEKIVATSSKKMVVIADESKQVKVLGKFPLPIEVVPMGLKATGFKINQCFNRYGMKVVLELRKKDGVPFKTDTGHLIVDVSAGEIKKPQELEYMLNDVPGVVNCGLFNGICSRVYMGTARGDVVVFDKAKK